MGIAIGIAIHWIPLWIQIGPGPQTTMVHQSGLKAVPSRGAHPSTRPELHAGRHVYRNSLHSPFQPLQILLRNSACCPCSGNKQQKSKQRNHQIIRGQPCIV